MHELWKDIEDCHGYQISSFGNVKSFKQNKSGKIILQETDHKGYKRIRLLLTDGTRKSYYVHRIVLSMFGSKAPYNYQCNHINGIKIDNRIENLEWVTAENNVKHAIQMGLYVKNREIYMRRGERHQFAKLKEDEVRTIKKSSGLVPFAVTARKYGVSPTTISKITRGIKWAHVIV